MCFQSRILNRDGSRGSRLFWTRTVWVEGERQILTFSPLSDSLSLLFRSRDPFSVLVADRKISSPHLIRSSIYDSSGRGGGINVKGFFCLVKSKNGAMKFNLCSSWINSIINTRYFLACVQTSPFSFHPRKRDVCETASLIVFQYPAVQVLNFA